MLGNVPTRLARNVVVSEYRKGHLSRLDVCDAHPELLRAAADAGEEGLPGRLPDMRRGEVTPRLSRLRPAPARFGAVPGLEKKELAKLARPGRDLACSS